MSRPGDEKVAAQRDTLRAMAASSRRSPRRGFKCFSRRSSVETIAVGCAFDARTVSGARATFPRKFDLRRRVPPLPSVDTRPLETRVAKFSWRISHGEASFPFRVIREWLDGWIERSVGNDRCTSWRKREKSEIVSRRRDHRTATVETFAVE